MRTRRSRRLLPILIPLLCALVVLALFRFVFYLGFVPSTSMEPTIRQGSLIIGLRIHGELRTGDIVIFRHEDRTLVKRIAVGPGETCMLNGGPVTVPAGCYLLLGDNAADSYDARYWDSPFTPARDIIARLQ